MEQPDNFEVFISHSGEYKSEAVRLHLLLRTFGVKTFVDRCNLTISQPFPKELTDVINKCEIGILLLGGVFHQKWCRKELNLLYSGYLEGKTLIPIFLRPSWQSLAESATAAFPDPLQQEIPVVLNQLSGIVKTDDLDENGCLIKATEECLKMLKKVQSLKDIRSHPDLTRSLLVGAVYREASTFRQNQTSTVAIEGAVERLIEEKNKILTGRSPTTPPPPSPTVFLNKGVVLGGMGNTSNTYYHRNNTDNSVDNSISIGAISGQVGNIGNNNRSFGTVNQTQTRR